MSLKLNHQHFGQAGRPALVILHGLMGFARNWTVAAKRLAEDFEVFVLDMRNHGSSPHDPVMSYEAMAEDVHAFLQANNLSGAILLGHSMGGKAAMAFACKYPDLIQGLVVADISPKTYEPHYTQELNALNALDVASFKTRVEAEAAVAQAIPAEDLRKFLLSNLVRCQEGGFMWQCNLPVLVDALPAIEHNSLKEGDRYKGPTLFIRGKHSNFMEDSDESVIKTYFPQATITLLEDAGHNVHVEGLESFLEAVRTFISQPTL
tara:strand:- start:52335 stop:53123 length:789 start_codon:yes stop_codon:yes gene_type:complete